MRVGGSSIHAQSAAVATTAIQQAACARCAATATAHNGQGCIARCVPSPGSCLNVLCRWSRAGWRSLDFVPFRTEHSCRHSKRSGHSTSNLAPIGRTRSSSGRRVNRLQQRLLAVLMGVPVHAARHHDGQRRRCGSADRACHRVMRSLRWNPQERSVQQRVLQSGLEEQTRAQRWPRRSNTGGCSAAAGKQRPLRWNAGGPASRWQDPDLLHVRPAKAKTWTAVLRLRYLLPASANVRRAKAKAAR